MKENMIMFHKREVATLKQTYKDADKGSFIKPLVTCIEISQTKLVFDHLKVNSHFFQAFKVLDLTQISNPHQFFFDGY